MGYILRIGYRHLEAIRSQTITVAMGLNFSKRQFDLREWLSEQAPELVATLDSGKMWDDIPTTFKHDRSWHFAIVLNTLLFQHEAESSDLAVAKRFTHSMVSTSRSCHAEEDHAGADQGGSWDADPFAFRAGVIFTLGALEEFERGTIRILTGLESRGLSFIGADRPFMPRLADYQATNSVWENLESKRKTFTPWGRAKILEGFGIEAPNEPWKGRLELAWRDRNQVAHGIAPVNVTLSMFLQTHYDVFEAMNWLSSACLTARNVLL